MIQRLKTFIGKGLADPGFQKYLANTSWLFAEQILRIVTGLLVGIYVARYLGPEKFGLFNYALALVALFASIAKLGMDGIIVRDLINAPEKRDAYLGTSFWLKGMGAILAGAGVAFAMVIAKNDSTTNLYIALIACGLIFQSFEVVDFYFQSRVLSKYVSICKISQLLLSSLLKIYLVSVNAELLCFVLVSIFDQVSLAAALVYAYSKQKLGVFYFKFDRIIAKELLLNAKPLLISGIMVSIYSSIDKVFIKEMLGADEVGLYTAATVLVTALYFVPYLIANSLFPAILNAKHQSEEIYIKRLSILYRYSISLGLIVCISVTIFSAKIINFLYGQSFADSFRILQIHIWNFLFICFSSIFGKWLLAENMQKINPQFTLVALFINVLGCYLLIPIWSIKGAAIAAVASQLIPILWFGITNSAVRCQFNYIFGMNFNRP